MEQAVPWPAARVLLLDSLGRVLLLHQRDFAEELPSVWTAPGGRVEEGESFEDAAKRELWEEVGLDNLELGPCVWLVTATSPWRGTLYRAEFRFFVCHIEEFDVQVGNRESLEQELIEDYRWWSVDEIEASSEVFIPPKMGRLLKPLFAGAYPDPPVLISL